MNPQEIDWIKVAYEWAKENDTPNPNPPRSEVILWAAFQQSEWEKRKLKEENKELMTIFNTAFEAFKLLMKE